MSETVAFTLDQPADKAGYEGVLRHRGRALGTLAGTVLRAQFEMEGGWRLLITDCDSPFEETLFIHLLGPDLKRRETLKLGGWYCNGWVEGIERLDGRSIAFRFPDQPIRSVVTVDPAAKGFKMRIATTDLESGRRRALASRYFPHWGGGADLILLEIVARGLQTCLLIFVLGQLLKGDILEQW